MRSSIPEFLYSFTVSTAAHGTGSMAPPRMHKCEDTGAAIKVNYKGALGPFGNPYEAAAPCLLLTKGVPVSNTFPRYMKAPGLPQRTPPPSSELPDMSEQNCGGWQRRTQDGSVGEVGTAGHGARVSFQGAITGRPPQSESLRELQCCRGWSCSWSEASYLFIWH